MNSTENAVHLYFRMLDAPAYSGPVPYTGETDYVPVTGSKDGSFR